MQLLLRQKVLFFILACFAVEDLLRIKPISRIHFYLTVKRRDNAVVSLVLLQVLENSRTLLVLFILILAFAIQGIAGLAQSFGRAVAPDSELGHLIQLINLLALLHFLLYFLVLNLRLQFYMAEVNLEWVYPLRFLSVAFFLGMERDESLVDGVTQNFELGLGSLYFTAYIDLA